ncbi:Cholinephosphotransferase 1 [Kluyveromyces marxianus]
MGVFIPHENLVKLKEYKYQSEDRSIISKHILKPFWSQFVKIFPLWMAPNVVTLSGFGFIIINVLTVLYLNPTFDQEQPSWAYFSYALGLFMYQTFDACDGTHARRTGQSGPLGELFDHCIDALNTTLSMLVFCSVVGIGFDFMMLVCQFALLCNFYLSTWEEYHTHKLFLSEFSGPVEGILMIVFGFILTGIFGPQAVWHRELFVLNFADTSFVVESIHVMFFFSGLGLIFNILSARRNVVEYYRENSYNDSVVKSNIRKSDKGLLPFFAYFSSVFLVAFVQPSFIGLPYVLSVGLTMAFTVGRIIVAHLTKQEFPMNQPVMFVPSLQLIIYLVFVKGFHLTSENIVHNLNWFGFGLTLGIHSMFITEIVYEFTNYLDIYTLSIKHPKKEE